jgi:5'-3' exonuclease
MNTLLVDGDNLLTIGFYGCKNFFHNGIHIGGIYHILNTLQKSIELYNLDKVVIFWDGEDSAFQRRQIYCHYKEDRKHGMTPNEEKNFMYQKRRTQKYLEEVYVRQGEFQHCESDDCIAYYVQNSPNENKIIYSSDRDLPQLLDKKTKIYNPSLRQLYSMGDTIIYDKEEVLIDNVALIKMICGDKSDSIYGIYGLGSKTFISFFPEIRTTPLTIEDVKQKANLLFEQNNKSIKIKNLLTGVTKFGVYGDEFFTLNQRLVDLSHPFLTDKAKADIIDILNEELDGEGRSYKNILAMMQEDGIFNMLPKMENAWTNFITPFLKLTRKEKNNKNIKNSTYARTRQQLSNGSGDASKF